MAPVTVGRWDWLLISIIVGTFASLIRWFVAHQAETATTHGAWRQGEAILASPWVAGPLRLAYAVGLPAIALFWQSALSARGLGLLPLPVTRSGPALDGLFFPTWDVWIKGLGWMVGISAAFWLIVVLGDVAARERRGNAPASGRRLIHLSPGALPRIVEDAVVYQIHWAFYREPFIFLWGTPLGIWLGAIPVVFEVAINPRLWEQLHAEGPPAVRAVLVRGGIFVASALVMIYTQNLWMALGLDLLVGALALSRQVPDRISAVARHSLLVPPTPPATQ